MSTIQAGTPIVTGSTGTLSYESFETGQTTLPSFITFDQVTLQFEVYTYEN